MSQPTVAIIGASSDRSKFGNKSVRAHAAQGYQVFPINPKAGEIEGHPAFASIQAVPVARLNRVSLYVPPAVGLKLIDEIAAKGCDELWLNPGSESEELAAKARALGLEPIIACSIVDVGESPHELSDE
jgi:predicted CoA-binding protein